MLEGGDILLEIYDIMSDIDDRGIKSDNQKVEIKNYLKRYEGARQGIESYLNQFDVAFTPDRGVNKLKEWKTNYLEQYRQFSRSYPTSRKNMSNWISSKNPEREQLLTFCIQSGFAYGEDKVANELLYAFNYDGLHIRSPKDAIYYFALKNKLSWEETREAINKLDWNSKSRSERNKSSTRKCTEEIRDDIDTLKTLSELVEHIQAHPEDFFAPGNPTGWSFGAKLVMDGTELADFLAGNMGHYERVREAAQKALDSHHF